MDRGSQVPSPRADGRDIYRVYKTHQEDLDKIVSDAASRPQHTKHFMEQQGYMYCDPTGLLRDVRNRLKEQARRQRLKSTPSHAATGVTELTASAHSSAVFNNPTSSIDLSVSGAAASLITSPSSDPAASSITPSLSDPAASSILPSFSDPAASSITPPLSDAAASCAAPSLSDKTASSATAQTPAAPTLAASPSSDTTISYVPAQTPAAPTLAASPSSDTTISSVLAQTSAAPTLAASPSSDTTISSVLARTPAAPTFAQTPAAPTLAQTPAAPTLASTAYQQTKLPFAPTHRSPLGPNYKVPPAQIQPVYQRVHPVSNLVVDGKPHGFICKSPFKVAIIGRLGRPKKCNHCRRKQKLCSAQFNGVWPCEACVQHNDSSCPQITELFPNSTPNVFQYKLQLDIGLVLNKISSTTRGFQSLKHVTIAARHSTNPSNFVNQVDLCRTAAHLCLDFHVDPTNIRFSGVQGFNMPSAHIPILEDQEEHHNSKGAVMFTNLLDSLLDTPGRDMIISPGVDTLTGHWERFTNWVASMPDPDDWFAFLWDTTIGGPPSENVKTCACYSPNPTRFWGFWRFRQINDDSQLGNHNGKLKALERIAGTRQTGKDGLVRSKADKQRGRNAYIQDNEDDDYEDNDGDEQEDDEWFC